MPENRKIAKAAGVVGASTLFSRILGFIRDVVIANYFGATLSADAFFVAFRIPNLLRRLFAEGSLTVSFVPVFTEYLMRKSKRDAIELAYISFTLLSMILVVVSILGVVCSPLIVRIIAPGFIRDPDKMQLTILMTRIMFPYIFFIGIIALCMGILNSLRHFAGPALSPILLNISMIVVVLYFSSHFNQPVLSLAIGVIIGGIFQLVFQFPFLRNQGIKFRLNFTFSHPAIKRIGILMLPAIFGAAVYQLNILISTILASFLPEGSVSYLYYAIRLIEFPLGIFAVAVGTAVLPTMSRYAAGKDFQELKDTLSFALRLVFFVTIPAMVGLIVLRFPVINILFQRGEFNYDATFFTASALLYYSLGLWAIAGTRIILPTFYSMQDTKTPVKVALVTILVNIIFSIILAFPLGLQHGGLALATSISSAVNLIILLIILRRRLGGLGIRRILLSVSKIAISSLAMGCIVHLFYHKIQWEVMSGIRERIFTLGCSVILGIFIFFLCSYLLRSEESYSLVKIVRERIRRN
ncbi:MAG: murein biosynthesis integral membrane protein MurJ [Thermodesulfobacteriota bacterium]|nr:murein biosynthesis integral membrane protein MurJ [Thermodesulfobacteriota bacterium]